MVAGPGGVGVSVLAAAGALRRVRSAHSVSGPDQHTLLITLDRLTPTPDLLGVYRVPGEAVAVSAGLHLLTLDRLGTAEQTWAGFTALLGGRTESAAIPLITTLAGVDAAEIMALPGIEEFLLLRRIRDEAVSGRWARIVVDLSGVGDPFVFLRCASVLGQSLERLWPRHRRLAAAAERPMLAQVATAVDAIATDCADIAELLTDAHTVAGHLVVGADDRGRRLLGHYLAMADLMGVPLRSILVNEWAGIISPSAGSQPVSVADDALSLHRIAVSALPLERPARLRKLGVVLEPPNGVARGTAALEVSGGSGGGLAAQFGLSWAQRLPDPRRFDLGRSDDELLVTVDGVRHAVRLPSVLRRCVVTDAHWDGYRIHVEFRPDNAVWPKHG